MMNSMMDLLSDRQIQTANTTDAKALSQMETLARDIGVEHVHHSPSPKTPTPSPASRKTLSWKWPWTTRGRHEA